METSSSLGKNRTGVQASPQNVQDQIASSVREARVAPGDESALASFRQSLMRDAEPIGSVPPPSTLQGMAKSGMKMATGKRPQSLVDKMGERLAFERTGVRLYEALLTKLAMKASEVPSISAARLAEMHHDELQHFAMLVDALQTLGADPTAETPGADLAGVESMGLVKVISDARTTFAQALHAVLIGELADNEGWEMLIELAELEKETELADRFRKALATEENHLDQVRAWMRELNRAETSLIGSLAS